MAYENESPKANKTYYNAFSKVATVEMGGPKKKGQNRMLKDNYLRVLEKKEKLLSLKELMDKGVDSNEVLEKLIFLKESLEVAIKHLKSNFSDDDRFRDSLGDYISKHDVLNKAKDVLEEYNKFINLIQDKIANAGISV